MLKVYVAGRYGLRSEAREIANSIEINTKCKVISEWHLENDPAVEGQGRTPTEAEALDGPAIAESDLDLVRSADVLFCIMEKPPVASVSLEEMEQYCRGGRHFEAGYAAALGKKFILLGNPESIFYRNLVAKGFSKTTGNLNEATDILKAWDIANTVKNDPTTTSLTEASEGHPRFRQLQDQAWQLHKHKASRYGTKDDPLANLHSYDQGGFQPWVSTLPEVAFNIHRRILNICQQLNSGNPVKEKEVRNALMDNSAFSQLAIIELERAGILDPNGCVDFD